MNRDQAKEIIRQRIPCTNFLEPDPAGGRNMYCCPFCGSGHGSHRTGGLEFYRETNTCCCHTANPECRKADGSKIRRDVFSVYQQVKGVDFKTALQELASMAGITLDEYSPGTATPRKPPAPAPKRAEPPKNTAAVKRKNEEYLKKCAAHAEDPDSIRFWESRGIDKTWLEAFGIGYDPQSRRAIIPTANSYVARAIDPDVKGRYMNAPGEDVGEFNLDALLNADPGTPVFITEGAIDAISIMQAGMDAVGLNSASRVDKFIAVMEEHPTKATLILTLDNDKAGEQARQRLEDGLTRLNIPYTVADVSGAANDPNEAAVTDMAAFTESVQEAAISGKRPDNTRSYINRIMAGEILKFKQAGNRKTGFPNLDKAIQGIYAGLYVVAASPGLGKTTLLLQIADQMAALGETVLFFTLEMSRLEMVSKSIARTAHQLNPNSTATSLSIRRGEMTQEILEAAATYQKSVSDRLNMVEGNFRCDIKYIENYAREFIRKNNVRPVIIIDYLQILQGDPDRRVSAKDNVDNTVTVLKRMSREMDVPVFVISSVNRAAYLHSISYESLKESGSIEYTCDVCLGLQFQVMGDKTNVFYESGKGKSGAAVEMEKQEELDAAKADRPRKIQLKCLKNRYGNPSFSCFFDYTPEYDLFVQGDKPEWAKIAEEERRIRREMR